MRKFHWVNVVHAPRKIGQNLCSLSSIDSFQALALNLSWNMCISVLLSLWSLILKYRTSVYQLLKLICGGIDWLLWLNEAYSMAVILTPPLVSGCRWRTETLIDIETKAHLSQLSSSPGFFKLSVRGHNFPDRCGRLVFMSITLAGTNCQIKVWW